MAKSLVSCFFLSHGVVWPRAVAATALNLRLIGFVIWSFMPLTATLIIISFSSHTLSFIQDLKPSFFCKSFPLQSFFFFFSTDYMIPQTFTVTSSIGCFYFLVVLFYNFFVVGSVRYIKPTYVGFRAHIKIASRIVAQTHVARWCSLLSCVHYSMRHTERDTHVTKLHW